jgi:hypothetical protein
MPTVWCVLVQVRAPARALHLCCLKGRTLCSSLGATRDVCSRRTRGSLENAASPVVQWRGSLDGTGWCGVDAVSARERTQVRTTNYAAWAVASCGCLC